MVIVLVLIVDGILMIMENVFEVWFCFVEEMIWFGVDVWIDGYYVVVWGFL